MKVLMFGWEFPPFNSGGLGVACYGITRALLENGTKITFVLPRKLPFNNQEITLLFADEDSALTMYAIQSTLKPYISVKTSHVGDITLHAAHGISPNLIEEVYRYAENAVKIAQQNTHDIIHAHDWLSLPAGLRSKSVTNKPLVAHIHATEFDRTGGRGANPQVYRIEKQGMEQADSVVAVSQHTKNMIIGKYGITPSKIEVVHNGIDLKDYPENNKPEHILALKKRGVKIVIFVGRITIQKGPDYFITVAKTVLEKRPDTLFVVAGSGDMEHQIMNLTAELGISDKVLFTGYVRGKELNTIFRSADLFVMPSVSEPFGMSALEAVASNTPVIISKQSGVSEVLSHALSVDFWDTKEMANKIISVLSNPSLHTHLKKGGRKELAHISWNTAATKLRRLYDKLRIQ